MTQPQRAAASECVRLTALLAESASPKSKPLALLVLARLRAVIDGGADVTPLTEGEIAPWLEMARKLEER